LRMVLKLKCRLLSRCFWCRVLVWVQLIVLLLADRPSCNVWGFTITRYPNESFQQHRKNHIPRNKIQQCRRVSTLRTTINGQSDNYSNDGWDEVEKNEDDSGKAIIISQNSENDLAVAASRNSADINSSSTIRTGKSQNNVVDTSTERDLFIPIFTLISLSGLMGAYAYEMIRLYLRGELYLPFLH
jgi:hypothetical protein